MYLHDLGIINALGNNKSEVATQLFAGNSGYMQLSNAWMTDETNARIGKVNAELPKIPEGFLEHHSRNNQLLLHAFEQIAASYKQLTQHTPPHRIGVVLGTSTSGVAESERAIAKLAQEGHSAVPEFHYTQQEPASPSQFLAKLLGIQGPCYSISTACTSSAFALIAARNLIQANLCDVVLTGGVDSLCRLTINGFTALESTTSELTNPMSQNRCGINIGEGAALFIMSNQAAPWALLGYGESNDAHHISAPDPSGQGAISAMQKALQHAKLTPQDIDYINLHATGTIKNDEMESIATHHLFGGQTPCSGTKPLIGHTLGASSAHELGFCWLINSNHNPQQQLPPHIWDNQPDLNLPQLNLTNANHQLQRKDCYHFMSNSFAFGGSNASLILRYQR